jgi:uncharacterized iron-regulated membrane protein
MYVVHAHHLLPASRLDEGPGIADGPRQEKNRVDGEDGALLAVEVPGEGTFGDIFMQAQFPLHSGRILGLPGRVLISVLGLVVAMLAVTGIVIWAKKRHARMSRRVKQRRRARTEEALTG